MTTPDISKLILRIALISAVVYFVIAFGLIFSQQPSDSVSGETLDFSLQPGNTARDAAALKTYRARDGVTLGYRHYPSGEPDAPMMIFIHGSGWHGEAYDGLARRLAASGAADIVLPDLRGHGPDPRTRGDIAYIGQFEDDIADLSATLRSPGQRLVLGGHSSGGGLVIRFAGGDYGATLDGAVLLAPYLKYNAPTTRPRSGGWARPLTRRIIGLSMLNTLGITALDHLTVIQFNFPDHVLTGPRGGTATPSYSHRLNTAFAPRSDYLADVAALPPFLLVAGAEDESFIASAYEPLMKPANPAGSFEIIDGVSHLGVIDDELTAGLIQDFLRMLPGQR